MSTRAVPYNALARSNYDWVHPGRLSAKTFIYIVCCETMVSCDDRAHLWPGQPHSKRPANVQKSLTAQRSTTRAGCATGSSGTALIAALQKLWRSRLPLPYNVAISSIRMFTDSESQQNHPTPFCPPPPGLERDDGEDDVVKP